MVDMAHIAGLVAAGGVHPNPVPYCEFAGEQHTKPPWSSWRSYPAVKNLQSQIDKAIFRYTGRSSMHVIAVAFCFGFGEALKPEFKEYGKKIVSNCKALADGLLKRGNKLSQAVRTTMFFLWTSVIQM